MPTNLESRISKLEKAHPLSRVTQMVLALDAEDLAALDLQEQARVLAACIQQDGTFVLDRLKERLGKIQRIDESIKSLPVELAAMEARLREVILLRVTRLPLRLSLLEFLTHEQIQFLIQALEEAEQLSATSPCRRFSPTVD